jgi:hypothetical protein
LVLIYEKNNCVDEHGTRYVFNTEEFIFLELDAVKRKEMFMRKKDNHCKMGCGGGESKNFVLEVEFTCGILD